MKKSFQVLEQISKNSKSVKKDLPALQKEIKKVYNELDGQGQDKLIKP